MDSLKKQRAIVKGSMTKLLTFVKGNLENVSVDEVYVKQERAQKLLLDFQSIEKAMLDIDDEAESDLSEFEDNYYTVLAALNAVIRKQSTSVPKAPQLDHTVSFSQQQPIEVRLPKISIPTFDGDYMEWQSFFDIYTSTIHERGGLTAAQKFQYLRGLLKGEAASLIRHLSVTDANYNEAFQKLIQRYDRKRHTINAFIKTYMDQPSILQPNAANIRKLTDVLDESIRGLKALGSNAERRDPWLIYIAINKLDSETRSLWAQETAAKELPTFEELLTFLGKRIDMIDSLKGYNKKIQSSRPPTTTRAYAVETSSGATCPICKQNGHRVYECDVYKTMSADQRSDAIKSNNRCFNCLNGNHRVHECRSRARCQQCYRKHHTSLHASSEQNLTKNEHLSNAQVHEAVISKHEEIDEANNITQTQTLATKPAISQTVLPTALIKIRDVNGQFHTYRALLDSGSQASFVSEACMNELRLSRSNKRIMVKGLGETRTGTTRGSVEITIASIDNKPVFTTQALIISKVSEIKNQLSLSEEDLQLLKKLQLADPAFNKRGPVDVLLGVDVFFKALLSDILNLPSGLTVISTTFGWVVAGGNIDKELTTNTANSFNVLLDIDKSLRNFWEVEEIPRIVKGTSEELKCEENFQSTTRYDKDNRFIVKLPFKEQENLLGTSYNAALNRLKAMEKRFEKDKEFGILYKSFMSEYEELGHMQNVPWFRSKTNKYYLPHHGVLKAGSATTKLRVVFDASAKSSTGLSLNDMLMVGPKIQPTNRDIDKIPTA